MTSLNQPESALYPPLVRYLEGRGYRVTVGVHPRRGSPRELDVVGVKPRLGQVAVVEAKTSHFPAAFEQALLRLLISDLVYVSFPQGFARSAAHRYDSVLRGAGIGLLAVSENRTRELLAPRKSTSVSPDRRAALIDMVMGACRTRG